MTIKICEFNFNDFEKKILLGFSSSGCLNVLGGNVSPRHFQILKQAATCLVVSISHDSDTSFPSLHLLGLDSFASLSIKAFVNSLDQYNGPCSRSLIYSQFHWLCKTIEPYLQVIDFRVP